jgi:hypothetical protein
MSKLIFSGYPWNHQTEEDVMYSACSMIVVYKSGYRALVVGNVTGVDHLKNATVDWPT